MSPKRKCVPGRRRGFSLLELLIVVAILLLLTTMYFGFGTRKTQTQRLESCQNNLQRLFIALEIYATDHREYYPIVTNATTSELALDPLVPKYTTDTTAFICPGSKDEFFQPGQPLSKHSISYAYYMGHRRSPDARPLLSDEQINNLAKTARQPAFSLDGKAPGNNHQKSGGNLLFSDGHAETTPPVTPIALPLSSGVVLLNPKP